MTKEEMAAHYNFPDTCPKCGESRPFHVGVVNYVKAGPFIEFLAFPCKSCHYAHTGPCLDAKADDFVERDVKNNNICPECRRSFIPADPRQRFCQPLCASRTRQRRFSAKAKAAR